MFTDSEVQDRVIDAASQLYYAQGIHEVGMDAVREASGVSLKRIYGLFSSKAALVCAVLDRRRAQWDVRLGQAVAAAQTPRERLLAIFEFLGDWFDEEDFRGCMFINAFGEAGESIAGVSEAVQQQKAAFQAYVEQLVTDAGAPASLARQLTLLAEGAQTSAAISDDPTWAADARRAAETLIDAHL